jgi:hypothetical protein
MYVQSEYTWSDNLCMYKVSILGVFVHKLHKLHQGSTIESMKREADPKFPGQG